jgi:hypothetical protein
MAINTEVRLGRPGQSKSARYKMGWHAAVHSGWIYSIAARSISGLTVDRSLLSRGISFARPTSLAGRCLASSRPRVAMQGRKRSAFTSSPLIIQRSSMSRSHSRN